MVVVLGLPVAHGLCFVQGGVLVLVVEVGGVIVVVMVLLVVLARHLVRVDVMEVLRVARLV